MTARAVLRSPVFWGFIVAQPVAFFALLHGHTGGLIIAAAFLVAGSSTFAVPYVALAFALNAGVEVAVLKSVPIAAFALALPGLVIAVLPRVETEGQNAGSPIRAFVQNVCFPTSLAAICVTAAGNLSPVLPDPRVLFPAFLVGSTWITPLLVSDKIERSDALAASAGLVSGLGAAALAVIDIQLTALALAGLFCTVCVFLPRLQKTDSLVGLAGAGVGMALLPQGLIQSPLVMAGIILAGVTVRILAKSHETLQTTLTELDDRIMRRTQRIRYLLHERDEVTILAVHDLQSPIQAVSGVQKTLLHMIDQGQTDASIMRPALEAAIATNNDLSDRIGSVLSANRDHLGGGDGASELFHIVREVAAAQTLPAKMRDLDIQLEVQTGLRVLNQEDIKDVLDVLLDNAIRHSPQSGVIKIQSMPGQTPDQVLLDISDQGTGVPDELIQTLFSEPRAQANPTGRQGIGLYLAHRRIRKLGGTLKYKHSATGSACFCVSLPLVRS